MESHHTTTPRNARVTAARVWGRRDSQVPQIANAANAIANAKRSPAQGRFEK